MWITDRQPAVPEADPCDYRTDSDVVLIQTTHGEHATARWVVYTDQDEDGIPPCWELVGRGGLQLDADEVAAWQPIARFVAEAN